jgi:HSP20 family protein
MFPFDKDKRVRKPSMFGGFDSFFADFDEEMASMMHSAAKGGGQSFIYGYRAYTGQDGKPVVEEYSNVPGFKGTLGGGVAALPSSCSGGCAAPSTEGGVLEPYHDVISDGDRIKVIVEMPGVEKKDIRVQSQGRFVSVKAEGQRKYAAEVTAPDYVESKPEKAQYKNGVLEIVFKKADKSEDVDVE